MARSVCDSSPEAPRAEGRDLCGAIRRLRVASSKAYGVGLKQLGPDLQVFFMLNTRLLGGSSLVLGAVWRISLIVVCGLPPVTVSQCLLLAFLSASLKSSIKGERVPAGPGSGAFELKGNAKNKWPVEKTSEPWRLSTTTQTTLKPA